MSTAARTMRSRVSWSRALVSVGTHMMLIGVVDTRLACVPPSGETYGVRKGERGELSRLLHPTRRDRHMGGTRGRCGPVQLGVRRRPGAPARAVPEGQGQAVGRAEAHRLEP